MPVRIAVVAAEDLASVSRNLMARMAGDDTTLSISLLGGIHWLYVVPTTAVSRAENINHM